MMEERLERFGFWVEQFTGPWVQRELAWNTTWLTLLAGLAILLLVLLADLIVRRILWKKVHRKTDRAKAGGPQHERESQYWMGLILRAAISPMALFIWIYGLYLVVSVIFIRLRTYDEAPVLIVALDWLRDLGVFVVLFWFLFRMSRVVDVRLLERAKATESSWDNILAPMVGKSIRIILPLVALHLLIPMLNLSPEVYVTMRNGFSLALILGVALILFQLVSAVAEGILSQFPVNIRDNLQARKIHTQVSVLKKVAFVLIGIFTVASMLMVFETVRQLGASILASAGIAGIIIGFAAQRSLATLLAGFQIAITQPIRVDDVVIVENEWGRIEEITLTYVVVRIWDLRRLIVPINYFIEKPFQNWTRVSADILGSVFFHLDYTVPFQAVREELDRILAQSKHWDQKVKVVHVTDAKPHTLEIRVLASAEDAGTAWDLRCEIREKMVEFLQKNYPDCLPRFRAEIKQPGGEVA
jgi:small-conductance mechanosensitive channel